MSWFWLAVAFVCGWWIGGSRGKPAAEPAASAPVKAAPPCATVKRTMLAIEYTVGAHSYRWVGWLDEPGRLIAAIRRAANNPELNLSRADARKLTAAIRRTARRERQRRHG